MQHEQVPGPRKRVDLAREHLVEPHVVGGRGEQRRIGRQRDRPQGRALRLIAHDILRREMLGVRGAAPIPRKEQRPARPQHLLVALRDARHDLGLLTGDALGQRSQLPEPVVDPVRGHAVPRRAAAT
jgi:hypothetical protein